MNYASPWKRLGAGIIDIVISFPVSLFLGLVLAPFLARNAIDQQHLESQLNGIGYFTWWIYFAAMESSSLQATLGKMAFGLRVTDIEGRRIGFWKASGRHWSKLISSLLLLIGFVMIFFTKKKQGLHDQMTGCVVLEKHVYPSGIDHYGSIKCAADQPSSHALSEMQDRNLIKDYQCFRFYARQSPKQTPLLDYLSTSNIPPAVIGIIIVVVFFAALKVEA